jgi:tRNA nucleotidyltransferase (CCA-adding enzyme)
VVEGEAIHLANRLHTRLGGRVISHNRFGTAKWQIRNIKDKLLQEFGYLDVEADMLPDTLDLISARTEFYDHPTALPTVERSSIKLDLHRRDFTINTMALRLDGRHFGELYDYWDGLSDLQKKQIKVLHSLSFVDDPTRLLRAVRFEQRFHFHIETRTLELMKEARPLLKQVSGDRLRHEFDLIFKEADPIPILARLQELGLVQAVNSAFVWSENYAPVLRAALDQEIPTGWDLPGQLGHSPIHLSLAYLVWLTLQDENTGREVADRLHLNNQLTDALQRARKTWKKIDTLGVKNPSEFAEVMADTSPLAGYALFLLCPPGKTRENLKNYYLIWRKMNPLTNGARLKELGLPPGPMYSSIIRNLRAAWIDGRIASAEEEDAMLKELLSE